jgi:hypothetical protein
MVPCAERTPLPNGLEAWSRCGARAYPLKGGTKYEGFATIRNWIDQLSQTVVPGCVYCCRFAEIFCNVLSPFLCAFFCPGFQADDVCQRNAEGNTGLRSIDSYV